MKNKKIVAMLIIAALVGGCTTSGKGVKVLTFKPGESTPIESEFEYFKPSDYKIGFDDLIEVNVWKHPDLSKEVIVRPDGKISYLLIGEVQAAGLTVSELDEIMTKKFETYAKELQRGGEEDLQAPPVREEYRIGLADELDISVWKIPDLSRQVIVRPDGKISYPLIGDVQAYGKTLTELDRELTEKLREYIKYPEVSIMITKFGEVERRRITFVTEFISTFLEEKPEVSVIVKRFGSRKVIVLGRVNSPGLYNITGGARLLDAIASASGFTNDAVKDNIFIIRGDIYAHPTIIKVDAWDIIRHGNYKLNIPLENQDVIYIPRSIVGNVNVLVSQIQPIVTLLEDSVELKDALKATFMMAD